MPTILIAQDHPDRPTRSVLVNGPDVPEHETRLQFRQAKDHGIHPQGMAWLVLWDADHGVVEKSFAQPKPQKDMKTTTHKFKAATLIAAIVGVLAFAVSPQAKADSFDGSSSVTIPTTMPASSTSNTTAVLDVRRNLDKVALQFKSSGGDGPSAGAFTLTFAPSVDGVSYASEAASRITWAIAANGTNAFVHTTNLTIGTFRYLKIVSVQNAATNAHTGLALTYSIKNP